MKNLGLNELRKLFLDYFESKQHLVIRSFSLIPPASDKSLLLIPAGMAPLKPYFTGQETPPNRRMASSQKCVRTNDIENVGITSRHCTFFEMLGNFSFGDYFKREAIAWAWEFLTEVLEIPANRLYPSVYFEDDEAFAIWRGEIGLSQEKIIKLGKEDNFWEHGVGPCGPCSEIYFDRGAASCECENPTCAPGCECDRFVEVWNLVFTQFNKNEDGSYTELSQKNIDTGMGLERLAVVMQGVSTVHDVDVVVAIRNAVAEALNVSYDTCADKSKSIRIISDHSKAVVFMLSDGIMPSNEGRGYVLRKLLRRAALHGMFLAKAAGMTPGNFLQKIAEAVISQYEQAYPDLREKNDFILKAIGMEEERFAERLAVGVEVFKKYLGQLDMQAADLSVKLGMQAFVMYDTYGFPLELTEEILISEGISAKIDESAFNSEMEVQRTRARAAREDVSAMGGNGSALNRLANTLTTEFIGYTQNSVNNAQINAIIVNDEIINEAGHGTELIIVPNITTLYAESGGQAGDTGYIITPTGKVLVTDCKTVGGKIAHFGKVVDGTVHINQIAEISTNMSVRRNTARNHSATHLLHKTLTDVLGSHVRQAGSQVTAERLRFDFTHFEPISTDELRKIEDIMNEQVLAALPITTIETTPDNARNMGAAALFDEKYGETVRVVQIGEEPAYSLELCGGTHVGNTSEIGFIKIISQTGVAAGVRRIEAISGTKAVEYYKNIDETLENLAQTLKVTKENIINKVSAIIAERDTVKKDLIKLKSGAATSILDEILANKEKVGDCFLITAEVAYENAADAGARLALADSLRTRMNNEPVVFLIIFKSEDGNQNATFMAIATKAAVNLGKHCGNIVKETLKTFAGRGGGRPDSAQGGFTLTVAAADVFDIAKKLL
ncbi:MAG: alanine--tRNA ligase [Defluviitaleaceae bacterium]|nr:alanine--tRNA ligase [Defluviitaleaceae bacterium]